MESQINSIRGRKYRKRMKESKKTFLKMEKRKIRNKVGFLVRLTANIQGNRRKETSRRTVLKFT